MSLIINDAPEARLSEAELSAWREIPVAVISDDLNRTGTMAAAIKPVGAGMAFAGQALTVQVMVRFRSSLICSSGHPDDVASHRRAGYSRAPRRGMRARQSVGA